jgi:hypothetical protein
MANIYAGTIRFKTKKEIIHMLMSTFFGIV